MSERTERLAAWVRDKEKSRRRFLDKMKADDALPMVGKDCPTCSSVVVDSFLCPDCLRFIADRLESDDELERLRKENADLKARIESIWDIYPEQREYFERLDAEVERESSNG